MNVCLFSANYLPNIGGVERYTYYLAKELIALGHSVTVVTNNVFDLAPWENTPESIELYRFPCYNVMKGRYPVPKKNSVFREIMSRLNKKKFDLVLLGRVAIDFNPTLFLLTPVFISIALSALNLLIKTQRGASPWSTAPPTLA